MTNRITLGASGLSVSPVSFGTWQLSPRFWGKQSKNDAITAMRTAFDFGINFFDTAEAYGDTYAETVVGEALEVIAEGRARMLEFGVADETAWQVGLSCGGKIKVWVEKID